MNRILNIRTLREIPTRILICGDMSFYATVVGKVNTSGN